MINLLLGISGFWIRNEQSYQQNLTRGAHELLLGSRMQRPVREQTGCCTSHGSLQDSQFEFSGFFPSNHHLKGSAMNVEHGLWKVHLAVDLGSRLSGSSENFSEQLMWHWRGFKKIINLSFCNKSHPNLFMPFFSNVVLNLHCQVFYFYWSIAKPNIWISLRHFRPQENWD